MESPDQIEIIKTVVSIFDKLQIPYFICGSMASSAHGVPRATQDIDLVADIALEKLAKFEGFIKNEFYIPEGLAADAIKEKRSFNIIHLKTIYKVDIFVSKTDIFSRSQMKRRCLNDLGSSKARVYFATPEDTILAKLEWYRKGGHISDRQWKDVKEVFKVQEGKLDMDYLNRMATHLGLNDLLDKVVNDG